VRPKRRVPKFDGDKSPAESGDKSPHSKNKSLIAVIKRIGESKNSRRCGDRRSELRE
jgi:hypothetical protein